MGVEGHVGPEQAAAQHDRRAQIRPDHRAQRIERLRESQPEMRTLRRAKHCNKRIGRDLQQRHTRGDHEQRQQDARVEIEHRRHGHEQTSQHHGGQRRDDGADEPQPRQEHGGRQRNEAVSNEPSKLCQHRFRVAQREHRFHCWDQRIDDRGDEPPREEQCRHASERGCRLGSVAAHRIPPVVLLCSRLLSHGRLVKHADVSRTPIR